MKISFIFLITTVVLCDNFLDQNSDEVPDLGASNEQLGMDISSYQGVIDWDRVVNSGLGIKFIIHRATVYGGAMDSMFETNYAACKARGIDFSCYHYSYSLSEAQAIIAAQNLVTKLKRRKMPIYLDLEWDQQRALGRTAVTNIAKAFIRTCKSLGYNDVNIYSTKEWYLNAFNGEELKNMGVKFWIAAWGPDNGYVNEYFRPNMGEIVWQYTSNGRVPGIAYNVDMNLRKTPTSPSQPTKPSQPINPKDIAIQKMVIIATSIGVNRRSSPDSSGSSNIVGGYQMNEKVEVVSITANRDFYKDKYGYYFTANNQWVKDLKAVVTAYSLNVRKDSNIRGTIIGGVTEGEIVDVLKDGGNGWYYIKTPSGLKGWSSGDYLSFIS